MKLETGTSARSRYNVLRTPGGILIHGPSCPRGVLTASHWVADFTCRCSEVPVSPPVVGTVSAAVAVPAAGGDIEASERFWAKVDKAEDGCWLWTACRNPDGYGTFWLEGHMPLAHRVAWLLSNGPIPDGLVLDHLCRNPPCVNPAHLEPVTRRENNERGYGPPAINGRKTVCVNGHELTPENVYIYPATGFRGCRICRTNRGRARPPKAASGRRGTAPEPVDVGSIALGPASAPSQGVLL